MSDAAEHPPARSDGYDHAAVERRWQDAWEDAGVFEVSNEQVDATPPEDREYVVPMFPYTSGDLHMGHMRNYAITDAYARFRRMQGKTVVHPMGWDAFGLPAENAAERNDTDPRSWTIDCKRAMRETFDAMGLGFDWNREVTTCDPDYYRWNQWLFRRFFEEGLVERQARAVNWCPDCETVLADEQVEDDDCWRCDATVTTREIEQWVLTITDYADELTDALDDLDGWPEGIRAMQRDWIGRQEGATVPFEVEGHGTVETFTTRIDTVFGATFLALSPDHPVAEAMAETDDAVADFVAEHAGDDGATDEGHGTSTPDPEDMAGVQAGTARNPATGEAVPVYVANFVLSEAGTGAVMGVPAHDERDHAFAESEGLPVRTVVVPEGDARPDDKSAFTEDGVLATAGVETASAAAVDTDPDAVVDAAETTPGAAVDPADFDGQASEAAREALVEAIPGAEAEVQYRLRDWLISRQRYWGTPIPVVHCEDCGAVPVPDEDLPVELPEFVHTAGNPLDAAEEWKRVACPDCGRPAERETETMDTFVDSSWYFMRYLSAGDDERAFDPERVGEWLPVDRYVGGEEHAVMHLLYARFVTKAIDDVEGVGVREPFDRLLTQGMVRKDGVAMSSSTGNVVSPERIRERYGADTARLFVLRAARPQRAFDWREEGVRSTRRTLERLHRAVDDAADGRMRTDDGRDPADEHVAREVDAAIAAATEGYADMTFVEGLREVEELIDLIDRYRTATTPHEGTVRRALSVAVRLIAPAAPHVAEELWERLGGDGFVADADWPTPERDPEAYERERRLVEQVREDVREIVDVVGIDDPERVVLTVALDWKRRVRERARETMRDGRDVVPAVMADEDLREYGDDAADYARDIAERGRPVDAPLAADREREALARSAWLIADEFDAEVRVETAEQAPAERVADARPGRPGIDVQA